MPVYHIHRMKDLPRQQFRWAPHTSGVTVVKPRDYEVPRDYEAPREYEAKDAGRTPTIEAPTPYAAWIALRGSDTPLDIGDILESEGELRILKYVGFEEARWYVPEPAATKAGAEPSSVSSEAGAAVTA